MDVHDIENCRFVEKNHKTFCGSTGEEREVLYYSGSSLNIAFHLPLDICLLYMDIP